MQLSSLSHLPPIIGWGHPEKTYMGKYCSFLKGNLLQGISMFRNGFDGIFLTIGFRVLGAEGGTRAACPAQGPCFVLAAAKRSCKAIERGQGAAQIHLLKLVPLMVMEKLNKMYDLRLIYGQKRSFWRALA